MSVQHSIGECDFISTISSIQDSQVATDILILHFMQGFQPSAVSNILSQPQVMVEEVISNFSDQFSNKEYLMNVIRGMAKNRKRVSDTPKESSAQDDYSYVNEIIKLREELTKARLEVEVYKEMINIAEQVFKIQIKKKFGAK